jgi:hypothetical protein
VDNDDFLAFTENVNADASILFRIEAFLFLPLFSLSLGERAGVRDGDLQI